MGYTTVFSNSNSYLIENTDPPKCTNCTQLHSVKHILTECTSYDQARHQYYSFTDIKNILSLTPSQNILNSIKKINLYHITSHHMVKTDAGLNGLYIREITIYIRLYY